jgi:hypothetical protein
VLSGRSRNVPLEGIVADSHFGNRNAGHSDLLEGIYNNRVGLFPYLQIF